MTRSNFQALHILMVDDDDQLRTALGLMLTRAGYKVSHAHDGMEAASLLREHIFDLVVTEVMVAKKDGFETLAELSCHSTPPKLIAMSSGSRVPSEVFLRMARYLGAHHVLTKPFHAEELLAAVRKVLGQTA